MLTMYFPHDLGPSIAKLCADHILCTNNHICLSCPYMLYVSGSPICMFGKLVMAMCICCSYMLCMDALCACHLLPGLHPCNQQCGLADH